jgi:hypothetical protein
LVIAYLVLAFFVFWLTSSFFLFIENRIETLEQKKEKKIGILFSPFCRIKEKKETKLHLNSEKASKNFFDMEE